MKTTLTIEQSQKLIELGVDPKMASGESLVGGALFILTDLLSILPKEIFIDKINISIVFEWQCDKWYACYMGHGYMISDCSASELIDSLYQLFIWCLENDHKVGD